MTRRALPWALALAVLGAAAAQAGDAGRDAALAERELAAREARQVIHQRAEKRAREAVLATERGRAHVRKCRREGRITSPHTDVFYGCNMDRWQPFKGAYERLYRAFWREEAERYRREVAGR